MYCSSQQRPLGPGTGQVFCPHHPDSRLIADQESGDLVCPNCGLVIGDRLVDAGAEWTNFEGDDKSRVGKAEDPLLDANDLSTIIGPSTGTSKEFSKYAKYSTLSPKEKSLKAAFRDIKDAAGRIHLSESVVETAFGIYRDVTDLITLRGGHRDALCIACLYISCNQGNVPRSFKEICAASTSSRKQVAKCYKEIMKLLKLEDSTQGREREFVERFCSTLGMGREIVKLATAIADAATETDLFPDRGPDVVCGASILLASVASNQVIRMRDMVQVSGATRNGLSVAYKTLATNTDKVFPADFVPVVQAEDLPKADEL